MYSVLNSYKFVPLNNLNEYRNSILEFCNKYQIKGTILLAEEGINIALAGSKEAIEKFIEFIQSFDELKNQKYQINYCHFIPFKKIKICIKPYIIKLGNIDVDMKEKGTYLSVNEWNDALKDENFIVVDNRNNYEILFGAFINSVNPMTETFSDMIEWFDKNLPNKDTNIAMCCTFGVRCEKSTAYLKNLGYKNVYQLEGGIGKYLVNVNEQYSLWRGDLFMFDDRIAVNKNLISVNKERYG